MRSASTPGPAAVFSATVASSSGKVGESETTFWKSVLALRMRAWVSRSDASSSGSRDGLHPRPQERCSVSHQLDDPEPSQALDDQAHGAVRLLEHLVDDGKRADAVEAVEGGRILGGIALHDRADQPSALHGILDEAHRRQHDQPPAA